jgi:hypothetical protein
MANPAVPNPTATKSLADRPEFMKISHVALNEGRDLDGSVVILLRDSCFHSATMLSKKVTTAAP